MRLARLLPWLVVALLGQSAWAVTLRWAAQNDVGTLDPHALAHATTLSILSHAYEGLVRYDRRHQVEPALAERWEMVTPTLWRFHLRPGIRFHDGSPMTADDVVFSFERIRQPQGTLQVVVLGVQQVRRIDTRVVEFVLDLPRPLFLRGLVDFKIMSRAWAEKNRTQNIANARAGEDSYASRNANGTGPFAIREWVPEQRIRLTANPDWWDRRESNVDEIVYLPIRNDATRTAALISGDVDLVTDLPTQDVARLRQSPALKVLDGVEVRTVFIGMDQSGAELQYGSVKGRNPFKDARVRRALGLAIERAAIQRTIMRGLSKPAGSLVPPGVVGYVEELDQVRPADPERARALLADAGYPGGFEITLDCPNNRYVNDEEICQAIIGMWARIGVRARLNSMPYTTFITKVLKSDTSAYLMGFGGAFDAGYYLYSLVRTKGTGSDGAFNAGRISDPRIDRLVDAAGAEMDGGKREEMLRQALRITAEEAFYLPIHHQVRPWAMKKGVSTQYRADDRPETRFVRIE